MAQMSTSEIISLMDSARFDPAGQLRNMVRRYNEIVEGSNRLVDPTNPYVFLMEMACAGAANASIHHETEMRRRHPMLALKKEDLYFHLTDRQYLGIFAQPPTAKIGMVIPVEDLLRNAVPVGESGLRVISLGKNSVWSVGEYTFTLEHPIDFKFTAGDSLTVGFGTPSVPALHPLETNLIETDFLNYGGYESVRIEFPVPQMEITSEIFRINRSTSTIGRMRYMDQYHYCRAYRRRTIDGVRKWEEIRTTHSEHVYDPSYPTVLVRDIGGYINLSLPGIYHTLGTVGDELRIDVYTTKGLNDIILSEYTSNQWTIEPRDLDIEDGQNTSAPFSRLNTIVNYSSDYTRGGREALSFDEIRERITEVHYGNVDVPITNVNREMVLKDLGFDSMRAIDGITTRMFNATRSMPLPTDNYLVSPINVGVFNAILRPEELANVPGITVNGDRTTLHPSVLYRDRDGGIEIVPRSEMAYLASLAGDDLARVVSNGNYLFSPFYNVIDAVTSTFELRTYHLNDPTVTSRQFVMDNPTSVLDLRNSSEVNVQKRDGDYVLTLVSEAGTVYKGLMDHQVGVQLSYYPNGANLPVVMHGTLVAKVDENRVWEFVIPTNYDVTAEDEIVVDGFTGWSSSGTLLTELPLTVDMNATYYLKDFSVPGSRRSEIDDIINPNTVPYGTLGILMEKISVRFGERLSNLWTGARPLVTPTDYEVYEEDIPRRRTTPLYARDPATGELIVELVNGQLETRKIADVGDIVVDPVTGDVEYVARKGVIVYNDGLPVVKHHRTLARQLDLVLFDGLFYFANDRSSKDYLQYVRRNVVQWTRDDLNQINEKALEETVVKFRPTATLGHITCVVGEGGEVTMDARQNITVEIMMTETDWTNENLKDKLRPVIKSVINEHLNNASIRVDNMILAVKDVVPTTILGVNVRGLGGDRNNYHLMTMKDGSGRPSMRMKLVSLPNNEYAVEEDISILFIPHMPSKSDR